MNKKILMSFVAVGAMLAAYPVLAASLDKAVPSSNVTDVADESSGLTTGAEKFVSGVAQRGLGVLGQKMSIDDQKKAFRSLLRDSFDLETIGRFALGKYWRVATAPQRTEYQHLFEKMIVDVYTARFSNYNGQKLVVGKAKPVGDNDAMVASQIVPSDGSEKVNVDWRVRKTGGAFKVVDVVVEGVSMGVTQRSDFGSVIDRGGGDVSVLINHLKNGGATASATTKS